MIERIVSYAELHEAGPEGIQVAEARFKIAFGPWKKGEEVACLQLDAVAAELVEWGPEGEKLRVCKVKMVPA